MERIENTLLPYEAPTIEVLGRIDELTGSGGGNSGDDNGNGAEA